MCGCEHHFNLNAPCSCSCPDHARIREEDALRREQRRQVDLRSDLRSVLNRHSAENGSDTPDGVLAGYLLDCLAAFDRATLARSSWYGNHQRIGGAR